MRLTEIWCFITSTTHKLKLIGVKHLKHRTLISGCV